MIKECITRMLYCDDKGYELESLRNMIKRLHEHMNAKYGRRLSVSYSWSMNYPTWAKLRGMYPRLCETNFGFGMDKRRFLEIKVEIKENLRDDVVTLSAWEEKSMINRSMSIMLTNNCENAKRELSRVILEMDTDIRRIYGSPANVVYHWEMNRTTYRSLRSKFDGLFNETYKPDPCDTERYLLGIKVEFYNDMYDGKVILRAREKINYQKCYITINPNRSFLNENAFGDLFKEQVNSIYGMPPHLLLAGITDNRNLAIKEVIYNKPATIIYWKDGDKTVVKCGDDEAYDKEKGFVMAVIKHLLGNKGNYYNEIRKWVPYEPEAEKAFEELTVKEYAKKHNMGESTVRHKLAKGEILGVKDKKCHWVIAD